MEFLNRKTLDLLLDSLLRRSLTFTPNPSEDFDEQKQKFIEAETAVHRWVRNELLPAVICQCPQALVSGFCL
ncbi:unnamed protein product [Echinostoma caproni]|uniref:SCAN box domain-containing protein n=1 Tax=Echinostoma caproni TaxID=27848 RepID=A0A183A3N5_9TREM|nr:unnamed protein product [Echinostoma caproni]